MTDLSQLLDRVAGEPGFPAPDVVASDLRRGQIALRRRRGLRAATGLVLAGAAIVVGLAVVPDPGDRSPTVVAPGGSSSVTGVSLVPSDDDGNPISTSVMPEFWSIYADPYALVISPPHMTTPPDDFEGKLVVTLLAHPHPPSRAQHVTVFGTDQGTTWRQGNTTFLLLRRLDRSLSVEVRAPESLGWSMDTLVAFASNVTLGDEAQPSDP